MAGELDHASAVRPCRGEHVSGDAAVVVLGEKGLFAAIVDALGHGPEAHEVAVVAHQFLSRHASADVPGLMQRLHATLKGTRGAVAGLCAVDAAAGHVTYTGTGNTVLRRFGSANTRLVSRDGVLGHTMRTPLPQTLQLEAGDLLVLYTDGVTDRFGAEDYPGLFGHGAATVARTIVERFGKDHDDAACIAVRYWR